MEAVIFIGLQASGKSSFYSQKNELLFQYNINFHDLPNWQKRGVGLCWEVYDKPAVNPVTGEHVTARRRRIRTEFDLPMKHQYGQFVRSLIPQPEIQEPDDGYFPR